MRIAMMVLICLGISACVTSNGHTEKAMNARAKQLILNSEEKEFETFNVEPFLFENDIDPTLDTKFSNEVISLYFARYNNTVLFLLENRTLEFPTYHRHYYRAHDCRLRYNENGEDHIFFLLPGEIKIIPIKATRDPEWRANCVRL